DADVLAKSYADVGVGCDVARVVGWNRRSDKWRRVRYVTCDIDVIDTHPFIATHCVCRDYTNLHEWLVIRSRRQDDADGRDFCCETWTISRIGNEARGNIGEVAAGADSKLKRDRLHRVVGGTIDIAQIVSNVN